MINYNLLFDMNYTALDLFVIITSILIVVSIIFTINSEMSLLLKRIVSTIILILSAPLYIYILLFVLKYVIIGYKIILISISNL